MNRVSIQENWPESWRYSYPYDLQEVFGEIASYGYAYAYDNRRRRAISSLRQLLAPGSKILDIAAAQGNLTIALAELDFKVTWNDLREDLADYVRLKQEKGDISFAPGNAFELGFVSAFDAVLIAEIIEHVAHPDEFLLNAARLVKPGGYILMTTPNGGYFRNTLPKFSDCGDASQFESMQFKPNSDGHIFLLHVDEMKPLAEKAGLEIKQIELFTNPLTAGHIKTEMILRLLPKKLIDMAESLTAKLTGSIGRKINTHMLVVFQKELTQ